MSLLVRMETKAILMAIKAHKTTVHASKPVPSTVFPTVLSWTRTVFSFHKFPTEIIQFNHQPTTLLWLVKRSAFFELTAQTPNAPSRLY
jgi:hypothetical protein